MKVDKTFISAFICYVDMDFNRVQINLDNIESNQIADKLQQFLKVILHSLQMPHSKQSKSVLK